MQIIPGATVLLLVFAWTTKFVIVLPLELALAHVPELLRLVAVVVAEHVLNVVLIMVRKLLQSI
jgi:hypothetical protein